MGFDIDNVSNYKLDENFISKQLSIRNSYETMGVIPSFPGIHMKFLIFHKMEHKLHLQKVMLQSMQTLMII